MTHSFNNLAGFQGRKKHEANGDHDRVSEESAVNGIVSIHAATTDNECPTARLQKMTGTSHTVAPACKVSVLSKEI